VDWYCGERAGEAVLDQEEALGAAAVGAVCEVLGVD
jgi:hypothetical protein